MVGIILLQLVRFHLLKYGMIIAVIDSLHFVCFAHFTAHALHRDHCNVFVTDALDAYCVVVYIFVFAVPKLYDTYQVSLSFIEFFLQYL